MDDGDAGYFLRRAVVDRLQLHAERGWPNDAAVQHAGTHHVVRVAMPAGDDVPPVHFGDDRGRALSSQAAAMTGASDEMVRVSS